MFRKRLTQIVPKGIMVNSGMLDGLTVDEAKKKIIDWLTSEGKGHSKVNYKLRDWVFSRQRYWGEPIPMVYCEKCGYVPIDEKDLPLRLPMVESYEPTDNGESPLAKMTDWINTTCPCCGGKAKERNRYNASVGRFIMVLSQIYGSAQ